MAMAIDQTEVRRVFEMFDRNGDGRITKEELSQSLTRLGMSVPEKDLSVLLLSVDANGDGCVDAEEFAELYRSISGQTDVDADVDADMREAFKVFDANGDGFISEEELRAVLVSLGLSHGGSREECRRMIDRVDGDGDGRVNFDEFCLMMKPSNSSSGSSSVALVSSTTT